MNKIFKLFPLAAAAFAFASCSSDDLIGDNVAQDPIDPSKLYVVVDELPGGNTVTRGGFNESVENGVNYRALFFQKGDKIKIYDDEANWRPQIWEYEGTANIAYTNSAGLTTSAVFTGEGNYTKGYGVFPADLGEFVKEDRSSFKFDLSGLKNAEYQTPATSTTAYGGKDYYVAPMPLWGYSTDNKMKAHYVTGFARIEVMGAPAVAANEYMYLVVQADKAVSNNNLVVNGIQPDDDAEGLLVKEPALEATTAVTATDLTAGIKAEGLTNADDIIKIRFGQRVAGVLIAYVPVLAGTTSLTAYLSTPIAKTDAATTTLKAGATENLGDAVASLTAADIQARNKEMIDKGATFVENNNKVQRAVFYNVFNDDANIVNASSPYALAEIIKAQDAQMTRPFTINVDNSTQPTVVDRRFTDTPNKYVLDLTGYTLKNDVTVNVAFTSYQNSAADILEVKTDASNTGTLKLNIASPATNALQKISFDSNCAGKVELTGTGLAATNFTVVAGTPNLTIKSSTDIVEAKAETNIDALTGTTTGEFRVFRVQDGCEQVNLKNGILQNVAFYPTLTKDVTIDGTGRAAIKSVTGLKTDAGSWNVVDNTATTPVKVHFITSAWLGSKFGSEGNAQLLINGGKVYFAAQLAAIAGGATSYTIMAKSLNLNDQDYTPVNAQAKPVDGNYTGAAAAKDAAQAIIKRVKISKTTGDLGLFSAAGNISNLILENVNIAYTNTTAGTNFGALVAKAGGSISNVTLQGDNSINAAGTSSNIGALIGTNTAAISLNDVAVTGTTTIKGYANMGGIIGNAADDITIGVSKDKEVLASSEYATALAALTYNKGEATLSATTTDAQTVCSVEGVKFAQNTKPGSYKYIPAYATIGDYIGTVADGKTVYIWTDGEYKKTAKFTPRPVNYTTYGQFTFADTDGSTYVVEIGREQYLVGLSGFKVQVDPVLATTQPIVIFFNRTAEKKFAAHKFVSKVGTTADRVDLTADNYLNYTGVVKE